MQDQWTAEDPFTTYILRSFGSARVERLFLLCEGPLADLKVLNRARKKANRGTLRFGRDSARQKYRSQRAEKHMPVQAVWHDNGWNFRFHSFYWVLGEETAADYPENQGDESQLLMRSLRKLQCSEVKKKHSCTETLSTANTKHMSQALRA